MSDFQYLQTILDQLVVEEFSRGDGHNLGPAEIHEYLSQVMYSRRSKMDPLWNALLVGGVKEGKRCILSSRLHLTLTACSISPGCRFLAYVDLLGTTYSASTLATGFGAHLAQPLLRSAVENREDILTEEEAFKILEQSMRVLFYRDARSFNKVCRRSN